jgi:hypothetical protein
MTIDFERYKNCPSYLLVKSGLVFDKMMSKWVRQVIFKYNVDTIFNMPHISFYRQLSYGESATVKAFAAQWKDVVCTRVVINYVALVPGGMPCDNNGTEATNRCLAY